MTLLTKNNITDANHPLDGLPLSPDIRAYIADLTPEQIEERIAREAALQGKTQSDIATALILLILLVGFLMAQEKDLSGKPISDALDDFARKYVAELPQADTQDALRAWPRTPRARRPYNPEGLVAALDGFERGDAEEQARTLNYLETAIDRDRPGQRRIFGPGTNPTTTDEAA